MTFKNAVKLLLNHYPLIWKVLLYLLILLVLIASLSASFAIPVFSALRGSDAWPMLEDAVKNFLNGEGFSRFFEDLKDLAAYLSHLFHTDPVLRRNSTVWLIVIMTVAYRFFLGLYELPLIYCLEGGMTDNARHGFTSGFIKFFGKSCYFSAIKMVAMILYDAATLVIMQYALKLLALLSLHWMTPFFGMVLLLALYAFRYSLISGWAPAIVSGGKGVFGGLRYSVRNAFKNFASLFTMFLIVWILLITLCLIFGLFTLGAGLLIIIPVSMLFLNLLNVTFYFNREKKRYHLDGQIFDPKTQTFYRIQQVVEGEKDAVTEYLPVEGEGGEPVEADKNEPPKDRN